VVAPRVVVVANPASGRGKAERLIPAVREALRELGSGSELRISDGPEDAPRLAAQACTDGADVVAAMGGDGMVGMVATALIGKDAALGVVPTGTGNDFARLLGIDRRHPVAAVRGLRGPRIIDVDAVHLSLGDGSKRSFVNVAGAGFDSEVNETANRMRTRIQGTVKYVAAVFKTLRRFSPATFEVSIDGDRSSLSGMLIAVGNGRSYGGGMHVCPSAVITDGILEVCVVGGMSKGEFVRAFPRVFRGTHVTHPKVTMLRGAKIEISADRHFDVYADGEPAGPLPAMFEVAPHALKVAVPEGAVPKGA
jgi:diacylglycerol kinase (ATP)